MSIFNSFFHLTSSAIQLNIVYCLIYFQLLSKEYNIVLVMCYKKIHDTKCNPQLLMDCIKKHNEIKYCCKLYYNLIKCIHS